MSSEKLDENDRRLLNNYVMSRSPSHKGISRCLARFPRRYVPRRGLFIFTYVGQSSRLSEGKIGHHPSTWSFRGAIRKSAWLCYTWSGIGTHTVAERPFLGGLRALMNLARSLRSAFDELPFIELSSPHETVISQWNYGSPSFSRSPTAPVETIRILLAASFEFTWRQRVS